MKRIILLAIAIGLVGCKETLYDKCVANGITYFKEIDAYPKLDDGRNSEKVAKERCSRSRVAFGSTQ